MPEELINALRFLAILLGKAREEAKKIQGVRLAIFEFRVLDEKEKKEKGVLYLN